jgi:hypothetical protein
VKTPDEPPSELASPIADLERRGYTHVEIKCRACGHERLASFFLLRARGVLFEGTTLRELAAGLKCAKCRRQLAPEAVRPVQQAECASGSPDRKVRRDSL